MGNLASQMRALALEGNDQSDPGTRSRAAERGPLLLILDDCLQSLPWESLAGLELQRQAQITLKRLVLAALTPSMDTASNVHPICQCAFSTPGRRSYYLKTEYST